MGVKVVRVLQEQVVLVVLVVDRVVAQALLVPVKIFLDQLSKVIPVSYTHLTLPTNREV